MRAYNYLLFRIYMFYERYEKGNLTFSTSIVSTVLVTINLITIYFLLNYFDLVPDIPNKFYVISFLLLVWFLNYYVIVRKEEFLNQNFMKDKIGGYMVVCFIVFTAVFSILVANFNRDKIFNKSKSFTNIETTKSPTS